MSSEPSAKDGVHQAFTFSDLRFLTIVREVNAEGWYQDPYKIHEDRWYSEGTPTALVRDGDVEAQDPPPPGDAPAGPLLRSRAHGEPAGPDDLRRADEAEAGGANDPDYSEKAAEVMGEFGSPG
jgi:hypothetical protein